jgi:dihydrolipoamide dehydrogenase
MGLTKSHHAGGFVAARHELGTEPLLPARRYANHTESPPQENRLQVYTPDVAIIGAGTAGLSARAAVRDAGATAILIERGPAGTTCARVGCMPSKLLIAAAGAARAVRRAGLFGVEAGEPAIDGRAVMARVQRERDHFVAGVLHDMDAIRADERIAGSARFLGPTTLQVDDHSRIEARAIVIATGARASVPPPYAALGDRVLTNETVFELDTLPRSLAVVGAGPLGLELALAFARLGVAVAVFDTSERVAGLRDPAVSAVARAVLGAELELCLGTEPVPAPDPDGVRLTWDAPSGRRTRVFARVLVAAGRTPNLDGLDLDAAGLARDDKGVPIFDPATLRCGESAIFTAGDADVDRPVLHEAANEGRIAGVNAARFPAVEPTRRGVPLSIVYTDPEIAVVGPGYHDDPEIVVGEVDLRRSGRARVGGRNAGLLRVYARGADHRLLGAELCGPDVEHLAHLLAWAVQLELSASDVLALPFYHPSLEESLRAAIRQICHDVKTGGVRAGSLNFGPGS